jgi:hypothetical protein
MTVEPKMARRAQSGPMHSAIEPGDVTPHADIRHEGVQPPVWRDTQRGFQSAMPSLKFGQSTQRARSQIAARLVPINGGGRMNIVNTKRHRGALARWQPPRQRSGRSCSFLGETFTLLVDRRYENIGTRISGQVCATRPRPYRSRAEGRAFQKAL